VEGQEKCPLPDDPTLAAAAAAINASGQWGEVIDSQWRWVYSTDAVRLSNGLGVELASVPLGAHYFGPEAVTARSSWRTGKVAIGWLRASLAGMGHWVLADAPGGLEELHKLIDPSLADLLDGLSPDGQRAACAFAVLGMSTAGDAGVELLITAFRVHDAAGRLAGTVTVGKPAADMNVLGAMVAGADARHLARMQQVARAGRRPAAILFADLEASSALSRRLSTASYFSLGRRMARAADRCVIDAGGLVGRHVGDGIVAFFLTETAGSESSAARSCIQAARALREAMVDVAARSELAPEDLTLRFGLHWGATLYVGQIATSGRTEVTALGDEVNEGARIEACATGGRALASKDLLERLDPEDAAALDLNPDRITYMPLAELPTATEKARRDAPAVSVCQV